MFTLIISKCTIIELILIAEKIYYKAPPKKRFTKKLKIKTAFDDWPTEAAARARLFI